MVSLDPELSKLFILLMSTSGSFGSQNGSTWANFLKRKLETSFLQHESKIEDSLQFFPDNSDVEDFPIILQSFDSSGPNLIASKQEWNRKFIHYFVYKNELS